jgi:hypothetical protein
MIDHDDEESNIKPAAKPDERDSHRTLENAWNLSNHNYNVRNEQDK